MLAVERARWGLGLYIMARKLQSGVVSFPTCFRQIDHERDELSANDG